MATHNTKQYNSIEEAVNDGVPLEDAIRRIYQQNKELAQTSKKGSTVNLNIIEREIAKMAIVRQYVQTPSGFMVTVEADNEDPNYQEEMQKKIEYYQSKEFQEEMLKGSKKKTKE